MIGMSALDGNRNSGRERHDGARPQRSYARFAAPVVASLACGPAQAHLNTTGMGPLYDGVVHFLTSPEDMVPALALALLVGLRGATYGRRAMFALPVAWLLGSVLGLSTAVASAGTLAASLWFLLLGGLVLTDARLSLRSVTALCALLGLFHGYLNGSGMGLSIPAVAVTLGLAAAVFALVVLVAALVVQLRAQWGRIAVRVGGSWIAASGLLMLGWSIRGI